MSEHLDINEMNNQNKGPKLSVFSELNGASITVGVTLICIVIASIVFYIFMNLSPKKTVKVIDDADIFTEQEEEDIKKLAKDLSKEKDISVVVVTTRDKGAGYSNSDDDEKRFAEDFYMKNVKTVPLQNNSGICILVDLTLDEPGQRFFWLYTYGTAHFAVSDDECSYLFRRNIDYLGNGAYGVAIKNIERSLFSYTYTSYGSIVFFTIIIPLVLAWLVTAFATPSRKLDPAPGINTYSFGNGNGVTKSEKFKSQRVIDYSDSGSGYGGGGGFSGGGFSGGGFSGGGGGFSGGGGGGFSGGGGGGGFSGGGGGRF